MVLEIHAAHEGIQCGLGDLTNTAVMPEASRIAFGTVSRSVGASSP